MKLLLTTLISSLAVFAAEEKFSVPLKYVDHDKRPLSNERLPPINGPHPRHENPNVALQYTTLPSVHQNLRLDVEGTIPDWASGVMLRNGFADFEAPNMKFNFLFDVMAGLYRFKIENGTVHFTNAFLDSEYYRFTEERGKFPDAITFGGTTPESNCKLIGSEPANCFFHDNLNVAIWRVGQKFFAISDFDPLLEFDPVTLETKGLYKFNDTFDSLTYIMTGAHPVPHPDGIHSINYLGYIDLPLMLRNSYDFYRVKEGSTRELIASIRSRDIAYVHSFAVTENYIVFAQFPLFYNILGIPLTGGPLIDLLNWEPEKGTQIWVINHKTGRVVKEYNTEAFFGYHHINAFEDDKGDIQFDITAFDDASHMKTFYLDSMREGPINYYPCSRLRRYTVPIVSGGQVSYKVLNPACHDLARINEQKWAKKYRYVYALGEYTEGDMYNCLIKMDADDLNAETLTWAVNDNYPSEPLFIPNPQGKDEDDGVILSVVLDGQRKQSFLLVLDAKTFEEIARAYVPPFIPFMSHGQFYNDIK